MKGGFASRKKSSTNDSHNGFRIKTNKMKQGTFDIKTATDEEVVSVIEGMLNAKKEWLDSVRKRERELGFA